MVITRCLLLFDPWKKIASLYMSVLGDWLTSPKKYCSQESKYHIALWLYRTLNDYRIHELNGFPSVSSFAFLILNLEDFLRREWVTVSCEKGTKCTTTLHQIFTKNFGKSNADIHLEVHLNRIHRIPNFAAIGCADANSHQYRSVGTIFSELLSHGRSSIFT